MAPAEYLSRQQELVIADTETIIDNIIELTSISEHPHQLEGSDLSQCPDCQTELTEYYDWDVVKYICENCGILINNLAFLKEES